MATALLERVRERHGNAADLLVLERMPQTKTSSGIREDSIKVGKVRIHYLEKGPVDGPVIILLQPSGNADPRSWEKVMGAMPEKYRVIAPGFQGFGKTQLPDGTKCTVENLADSMKGFLSEKGIEGPISMMGTSAGAFVAMMFAVENPGRVERLAIIDSYDPRVLAEYPGFISRVLSHPELSRKALGFGLKHKRIMEVSMGVYGQINGTKMSAKAQQGDEDHKARAKSTLKVYINALRDVRNGKGSIPLEFVESTINYLSNLRPAFFHIISDHRRHAQMFEDMAASIRASVPVRLVIHGAGDQIIKEGASSQLAGLLDAKYRPIEGAGHAPHRENTERFMEIIKADFLPKEEATQAQRHQHRSLMSRLLRRDGSDHAQKVPAKEVAHLTAA